VSNSDPSFGRLDDALANAEEHDVGRFIERKTLPISLAVPLGWPLRSGGQAPEADALSTELQARGPR
jgi:hypothetical protein